MDHDHKTGINWRHQHWFSSHQYIQPKCYSISIPFIDLSSFYPQLLFCILTFRPHPSFFTHFLSQLFALLKNPIFYIKSNPTNMYYTRQHLLQLLRVVETCSLGWDIKQSFQTQQEKNMRMVDVVDLQNTNMNLTTKMGHRQSKLHKGGGRDVKELLSAAA